MKARHFKGGIIHKLLVPVCCTFGLFLATACGSSPDPDSMKSGLDPNDPSKVHRTEAEWKKLLPEKNFEVTRKGGTEQAYTGKYWDAHDKGTYGCYCCGQPLFSSETKFDSGTGWPSFFKPITKNAITRLSDASDGMERTEVRCSRCDAHLGHVFDDGPKPTGLRFCMNSLALRFTKSK